MSANDIKFSVYPDLAAEGVKVKVATFSVQEISKRRGSGLEKHIEEVLASLNVDELLKPPVIEEYKRLQREAGIQEPMAPAEHLLRLVKNFGKLPNINKVVDCYNIASAETLLSMGAHDLAHIRGDVQIRRTDGSEKYTPLGATELEKVAPHEYAAIDEEKILCRLDLKQCDETKCGRDTKNF